ncbi:MAG TPA: hypothetical protein VH682_20380, partial [Gemmataceae bacterium]
VYLSKEKDHFIVQWWNIESGRLRRTFQLPISCRREIACSPDGKRLAGLPYNYQGIHVWDVPAEKEIGCIKETTITRPLFSPDGKKLATAATVNDKLGVRLWDAMTLNEQAALEAPAKLAASSLRQLRFSPDSRFLAGVCDDVRGDNSKKGVIIWDLSGKKKPQQLPERGIQEVAIAAEGKTLACCSWDREIRLWDLTSGRPLHHRPGDIWCVSTLAASADGRLLASNAPTVRLWDAATGKPLRAFAESGSPILISFDGTRVISADRPHTNQNRFLVWDAANGQELRRFLITRDNYANDPSRLEAIGLSTDGKRLTAVLWDYPSEATQVYHWEIDTGRLLSKRSYPAKRNSCFAAVSPDGERVCLGREEQVILEEARTGRRLRTLPKTVRTEVFSPDGRLLAAKNWQPKKKPAEGADWKGLSLIETASGKEVLHWPAPESSLLTFTADGHGLVGVDKDALRVWDVGTGKLLHEMAWPASVGEELDEPAVQSLVLLPGGRAATGMNDTTILVWDLAASTWPGNGLARDLNRRALDALWADLGGEASAAHRALHTLAASPTSTLPYLSDHLPHAAAAEGKRIERLLADLDSDAFEAREAAIPELISLREWMEPMLRRTLENKPSLEVRRRLQTILTAPNAPLPSAKTLRLLRAIAVLEHIGTPEARRLLEKLSRGAASPETRQAQAALRRLRHQDAPTKGRSEP